MWIIALNVHWFTEYKTWLLSENWCGVIQRRWHVRLQITWHGRWLWTGVFVLPVVPVSSFSVWPCWSFMLDEQEEERSLCARAAIEDLWTDSQRAAVVRTALILLRRPAFATPPEHKEASHKTAAVWQSTTCLLKHLIILQSFLFKLGSYIICSL